MITHKFKISEFLKGAKSEVMIKWFEEKLSKLEISISELVSAKNANIVNEQVGHLNAWNGQFSQTGMWKVRRKLFPTVTEPPTAKKGLFRQFNHCGKAFERFISSHVRTQIKDETNNRQNA